MVIMPSHLLHLLKPMWCSALLHCSTCHRSSHWAALVAMVVEEEEEEECLQEIPIAQTCPMATVGMGGERHPLFAHPAGKMLLHTDIHTTCSSSFKGGCKVPETVAMDTLASIVAMLLLPNQHHQEHIRLITLPVLINW